MLKKVEAIVRRSVLKKVLDELAEAGYPGVTVSEVEGHGKQKGITAEYRGQTYVNLLSKYKLEIVVNDGKVRSIVEAISRAARTGEIGDGKIFVLPIEDAIRIRTGETGESAL